MHNPIIKAIELLGLGPRASAITAKMDRAEVNIFGEIGFDITAPEFINQLREFRGAKHLDIHILSAGGSVFEGFAMANAISSFPGETTVFIDGLAASIASLVAISADRTVIAENGFIAIHDPFTIAQGTAEDLRHRADILDQLTDQLIQAYHTKTGLSRARISALMDAETWFNANDAVKIGLADEVGLAIEIAANIDIRRFYNMSEDAKTLVATVTTNDKDKGGTPDDGDTTNDASAGAVGAIEGQPGAVPVPIAQAGDTDAAYQEGLDAGKLTAVSDTVEEYKAMIAVIHAEHSQAKGALDAEVSALTTQNQALASKVSELLAKVKRFTGGLAFNPDDADGGAAPETTPVLDAPSNWQEAITAAAGDGKSYEDALVYCEAEYPALHKEYIDFSKLEIDHR